MNSPILTISGFSGAGKDTLIKELLTRFPDRFVKAVSYTTRPPRPGEVHGFDYYFLDEPDFNQKEAENHFFEKIEFDDHKRATPHPEKIMLEPGQYPLYNVDIRGALRLKEAFPTTKSIFLYISPSEQIKRLIERGQNESEIERRQQHYQHEKAILEEKESLFEVYNHSTIDDLEAIINKLARGLKI